jgi:2-amino-4-hydroxy-6-hydroxymethyldihydropteridine diphosphokinase
MPTILIGVGGNLPHPVWGAPLAVVEAALADHLGPAGMVPLRRSRWYLSAPVPPAGHPPYVNGVVEAKTAAAPRTCLASLHGVEAAFGRVRQELNGPRVLDLDLLAYDDLIVGDDPHLHLPHPRLHERAFVLRPLMDLRPHWRHPVTLEAAASLLAGIGVEQALEPLEVGGPVDLRPTLLPVAPDG